MTVESAIQKSGPFLVVGSSGTFPRGFLAVDPSHIRVIRVRDGAESDLLTGVSHTGIGTATGTVTVTAGIAAGDQVYLLRAVPNVQRSDYSTQGTVPTDQVERDFDLAEMQIQDLAERQDRALMLPMSSNLTGEELVEKILAADSLAERAEVAAQVVSGGTRANFVAMNGAGLFIGFPRGSSVMADGLIYTRRPGANSIPDLAGWEPGNAVAVPQHFGVLEGAAAPSTAPLLVVDSGQSNAVGLSTSTDGVFPSNAGVFMWLALGDSDAPMWVENPRLDTTTYRIPVGLTARPTIGNGQNNAALAFAHRLKQETGRDVYVIVDARGSQGIDNWIANGTASVRYQSLQIAVAAAMPGIPGGPIPVDYFLWQQGETDAVNGTTAATHLGKLGTLFAQLAAESWWSPRTKAILGECSVEPTSLFAPVNAAIRQFCAADASRRGLAKSAGLPLASDRTHFTNLGLHYLGFYRYWDAVQSLALPPEWAAFLAWSAPRSLPAGEYRIGERKLSSNLGTYGTGDVRSRLSGDQRRLVSVGLDRFAADQAQVTLAARYDGPAVKPALFVSTSIADDTGAAPEARVAGIFSYMEQTGRNTQQYPKAIAGTAVNAAGGNNDATGVVGYAIKLDVPADGESAAGTGDAAGTGGVCWQRSRQSGLAIGAEFACHMAVEPTYTNGLSGSGNRSMAVHVTTNSGGGPLWAGISLDSSGLNPGYFGYYSAINFSRSCFGRGGEGVFADTVGLNFGSNTVTGPEKAVYLGNARWHLWREGVSAIRAHALSLDLENRDGNTPGVRLITPTASPQGGYFGVYRGSVGADGTSALTTMGAFIVGSDNYAYLAAYDASGTAVSRAGCSPATNAFVPLGASGAMALGGAARLWSQVYAASGTINTSDERAKTDISAIPDAVLDAWGRVNFAQFRFVDAVSEKGDGARVHFGVIAQRVMEAFAAEGLDAADYGLLCHDSWDAVPEVTETQRTLVKHAVYERVLVRPAHVDDEGMEWPDQYEDGALLEPEEYQEVTTITPGVPAGDRYGIRYEEALCMEAAYQRRRADRIEARIAALEQGGVA